MSRAAGGRGDQCADEIVTSARQLDWVDCKHLTTATGQPEARFGTVVVKELLDNALDAAERARAPGRVHVEVVRVAKGWRLTVADAGPGLSAEQLRKITDFSSRASSKDWRRGIARGAQGNAFKTVMAIPAAFARRADPHARMYPALRVVSQDCEYEIAVEVDSGAGTVQATVRQNGEFRGGLDKSNGLSARAGFCPSTWITCDLPDVDLADIRRILEGHATFNPAAILSWRLGAEIQKRASERRRGRAQP
jgi:histidine kinase/DNA gyrase B/HSP90-like ATPase